MNVLQVQEPPVHDYCIIAVPEKKIKGKISDIEILKSDKSAYDVVDVIQCLRNGLIPSVLILMATGSYINDKDIWKAYNKSNSLYFFLCKKKKIESSTT
jgi:hypothetical protein